MEDDTVDAPDGPTAIERTILFADIAGSTRLLTELGDERGRLILEDCLERMTAVVRACGAVAVEVRGDEILSVFPEPGLAAEASVAMASLAGGDPLRVTVDRRVRLRIGFVHGPVIETSGVPFGATVHLAARVVSLAKSGQVLTTKETLFLLGSRWQRVSRYHDRRVLKGLPGEQQIYELLPETDVTAVRRSLPVRIDPSAEAVELGYAGRVVRVDAACPRVELGRDAACDLHVEGSSVSRLHATVEWDGGRVRLEDLSTNGTRVECAGAVPIEVRHRSTPLSGEGVLRLGADAPDEQCALVSYRCLGTVPSPRPETH